MSSLLLSCNTRRAVTSPFLTATRNITKTVVIKGLPANLTQKNMEDRFSSYGRITDIRFLPTKEHLEKFKTISAILSFADINSALAVVDELQHAQVFNRRITVEFNRFTQINNRSPSNIRSYEDKNRRYEPRNNDNTGTMQQRPRQSIQSKSPPSFEQPSSQSSNQYAQNSLNGHSVEVYIYIYIYIYIYVNIYIYMYI
jgi:RNA recognition motif-containing protein